MSKRFRLFLVLAAVIVAGLFLFPTIQWYFLYTDADRERTQITRSETIRRVEIRVEEVLESLRAAVLEDPSQPIDEEYAFLIDVAADRYEAANDDIPEQWSVVDVLGAFTNTEDFTRVLNEYYLLEIEEAKTIRSRIIQLGLDLAGGVEVLLEPDTTKLEESLGTTPTDAQVSEAVDLALGIIGNRIDRFGVTEPQIRKRSDNTIEISLPGENDPDRVNAFLVGKGQLNFHIVNDPATSALSTAEAFDEELATDAESYPNDIPAGSLLLPYYIRNPFGIEEFERNIVIYTNIEEQGLSGEYIQDAQFLRDELTNQPTVNFVLDVEGSNKFAALTSEHVGNSMAIVVDNRVRAYALIREEIPNGQVRISGFDETEAQGIAQVLRTAALPLDLEIINQIGIGSLLGAETTRAGLTAIVFGLILVVLFVLAYYKGAGLIADIMLLLNLFILVSILSVFNLTLTLTSIAGIILTVGMAVDANVIIYERIKEEYHSGKSPSVAVKAGFSRAFWTIMDANITTFIAALFLSQFGTGPIRGFAVTLAVGLVTSMFTALFVSRLFFEFFTEQLKVNSISISWSKRITQ